LELMATSTTDFLKIAPYLSKAHRNGKKLQS
jgi:hypothetical protein